ncbi:hypothetical protein ANCCAN_15057 [Ancylostoma caninum]|uniref:Delta-like protein n=1 Tax=Ancylostoma caninum TaxID=29170 RepID=A0A368G3L0_ANCCA|nr:hypothetical protein ANCCAN_15057 [Ancylostoma caninum]
MFLIRISSEERHNVQYCFTELPYTVRRTPNSRCLKSGELNVAKKTERVIDLRLMNSTSAYLAVEFSVTAGGQGPPKTITERVVVDGALPAKRIAIASGLVLEFVTICDRPWYGLMCSRYCIERSAANYVCDPRGEKVCLVGWTGKDCDIATKNVFPTLSEETDPPSSPVSTTLPSTGRLPSQKHEPAVVKTTTSAGVTSFSASTISPTLATTTELFIPKVSHPVPRFTTIRVTHRTRARSVSSSTREAPASTVSSQSGNIEVLKIVSPADGDNSTSSCIETVITVFLVLITSALLGYLLTMCVRNSSVQNWINDRKAGIFAPSSCTSSRKYNSQEPLKEVFVIGTKKADVKVDYESTEKLGPRYSSEPTAAVSPSPSANDESVVESNTYHEIDSFLVSSVVDLRIATLV